MNAPTSNYPTAAALVADMRIAALDAIAARGICTVDDLRRAGLSSNGVVLDATEGVRKAFSAAEIDRHAPAMFAELKAERGRPRPKGHAPAPAPRAPAPKSGGAAALADLALAAAIGLAAGLATFAGLA